MDNQHVFTARSDATLAQLQDRIGYERHMQDVFARRTAETLAEIHKLKAADAKAAGHVPRTA